MAHRPTSRTLSPADHARLQRAVGTHTLEAVAVEAQVSTNTVRRVLSSVPTQRSTVSVIMGAVERLSAKGGRK